MRLKDRVTVITGGGSGIGLATAMVFASEGAKIVVAGRNETSLKETVNKVEKAGGEAIAVITDVAEQAHANNLIEQTIEKYGRIDILVNNHAHMPPLDAGVIEMPDDYWNDSLKINLTGTMMTCRAALKYMVPQKSGSIVNVSSIAGTSGDPHHSSYSASKWGLIGFTASLAGEVGKDNIRANVISPAATFTEGFEMGMKMIAEQKGMSFEVFMHKLRSTYALRRVALPSEIATAILFLASDDASAVTGQNLIVSCGFQLTHPGMIE
jgi:NAD(P)-dependent dehydrogenase (short-subunit alcohol dehydrogenase family)